MKKYFIHYFTDSLFSVNSRDEHQKNILGVLEFKFGSRDKVLIRDALLEIDGMKCFSGLDCYLSIHAANSKIAKNAAKAYVETILNLMSFATIAYSHAAYLQSVIEINSEKDSNHSFEYFIHKHIKHKFPLERALRKINPDLFRNVWNGWDKIKEEKVKSRINRAISWLRKGLMESDIDEFIAYFIGLEILGNNLNDKLGLKHEETIWGKLRNLLSGRKYFGTDWTGLEKIFADHKLEIEFIEVKKRRNDIFHGYKKLDLKFVEEIKTCLPELRKALIIAISILIDIDPQLIIDQKYTKPVFKRWDILKGHFSEFTDDIETIIHTYPKIKARMDKQHLSIDDEGNLQTTESWKYDFICEQNHTFNISECQSWAANNTGIKKMRITKFDEEDVNW